MATRIEWLYDIQIQIEFQIQKGLLSKVQSTQKQYIKKQQVCDK